MASEVGASQDELASQAVCSEGSIHVRSLGQTPETEPCNSHEISHWQSLLARGWNPQAPGWSGAPSTLFETPEHESKSTPKPEGGGQVFHHSPGRCAWLVAALIKGRIPWAWMIRAGLPLSVKQTGGKIGAEPTNCQGSSLKKLRLSEQEKAHPV